LGGQYADYIEKQLLAYRRGERASGANALIMQGVAANLSDKEIKAVANYISGLN
jgi:cytochrome c553